MKDLRTGQSTRICRAFNTDIISVGKFFTSIMESMTVTVQSGNYTSKIPLTAMKMWISILLRHLASCLVQMAEYIDKAPGIPATENKIQMTSVKAEDEEEIKEKEIDLESNSDDKVLVRERSYSLASTDSGFDRDLENLDISMNGRDEETGLDLISLDEVTLHNMREDAWLVVYDKVYEMTEYLESSRHPGGEDVILEYLGYDATLAFRGVGHSKGALRVLDKYCIGILPRDERLNFSSE